MNGNIVMTDFFFNRIQSLLTKERVKTFKALFTKEKSHMNTNIAMKIFFNKFRTLFRKESIDYKGFNHEREMNANTVMKYLFFNNFQALFRKE